MKRTHGQKDENEPQKRRRLEERFEEEAELKELFLRYSRFDEPIFFNRLLDNTDGSFFDRPSNYPLREQCALEFIRNESYGMVNRIFTNYMSSISMRVLYVTVKVGRANMLKILMQSGVPFSTDDDSYSINEIAAVAIALRKFDILKLLYQVRPFYPDSKMVLNVARLNRPEILDWIISCMDPCERQKALMDSWRLSAIRGFSCGCRYALEKLTELPSEDNFLFSPGRYLLKIYKLVAIDEGDFDAIKVFLEGHIDLRGTLFLLAVKTLLSLGKTQTAVDLMAWNRTRSDQMLCIIESGSEMLNLARTTNRWDEVLNPDVARYMIPPWHFISFLRERIKNNEYECLLTAIDKAPEFLSISWMSAHPRGSRSRCIYETLLAASKGDFRFLLIFMELHPWELGVHEFGWSKIFDTQYEFFLPLIQAGLARLLRQ